ncbi:hypothetical protein ACWEKT_32330 [Nocardia takedensis]
MSAPEDRGDLAGWKAGLLAKIQARSLELARVLSRGYPEYVPAAGRGEVALANWRAHLSDLEADRHELILRASASGIPAAMISEAIDNGSQGRVWGESARNPPTSRYGDSSERTESIARLAEDVWTLEHMAVIEVEHRARGLDNDRDHAVHDQYRRNMEALWTRADRTAALVDPDSAEARELFGRDVAGWRRLAAITVTDYSDSVLEQLWRVHAWGGVESDVVRTLAYLPDTGAVSQHARPATREVMLEHAGTALDVVGYGVFGGGSGVEDAARTALSGARETTPSPEAAPVEPATRESTIEPEF